MTIISAVAARVMVNGYVITVVIDVVVVLIATIPIEIVTNTGSYELHPSKGSARTAAPGLWRWFPPGFQCIHTPTIVPPDGDSCRLNLTRTERGDLY